MCIIIAGRKRKPSLSALRTCEKSNTDGGGVAWATEDGTVKYVKGVSAEDVHQILRSVPGAWTAHFRIATVGGAVPALIHPFPVSDEAELKEEGETNAVLFHNGTFTDWREACMKLCLSDPGARPPEGPVSDSRALAWLVNHRGPGLLNLLSHGKFVLLSGAGYQILPGRKDWVKDKGVWYSNTTFRGYRAVVGTTKSSTYGHAYGSYGGRSFVDDEEEYKRWSERNREYSSRRTATQLPGKVKRHWHEEMPSPTILRSTWEARQRGKELSGV